MHVERELADCGVVQEQPRRTPRGEASPGHTWKTKNPWSNFAVRSQGDRLSGLTLARQRLQRGSTVAGLRFGRLGASERLGTESRLGLRKSAKGTGAMCLTE